MDSEFTNPTLPEDTIIRVNGGLLKQFVGSLVALVGTVKSVSGSNASLLTSDGQMVSIYASNGFKYPVDKVVEVIGVVNDTGVISLRYVTSFEGDYNAAAYDKLVGYMNGKFHGVFY